MASEKGRKGEESSGQQKSGPDDLKEREYRDSQGNIHHHTRTSKAMQGESGGEESGKAEKKASKQEEEPENE